MVAVASAALVAALVGTTGPWLADAGAIAVSTAYTWGLAARTGGRTVVFSALTLALGGIVVALDNDPLRSGAAVVTAVLTAVFAVMITVPAVHFAGAVRENLVALVVAAVGAMATVAWAPVVSLDRFQYTALGLSLVAAFVVVFRLGAGFHGLGSRGVLTVVGGSVMLALTLGYAELLRRYGTQSLVETLDDAVIWSRHHLGAFPRPIIALLGVPALTWGTHMRAQASSGLVGVRVRGRADRTRRLCAGRSGAERRRGRPRHGVRIGDRPADRLPADPRRPEVDRPARPPAGRDRGGERRSPGAGPYPRPVVTAGIH